MTPRKKYYVEFILLILILIVLFVQSLCSGTADIGFFKVLNVLRNNESNNAYIQIVFEHRFPKAIAAVLCGVSLSVCGLMMQTLFRNPLAGPDVLGINSGSSLFVAFFITGSSALGMGTQSILYNGGLTFFAAAGSLLTLLLILAISLRIKNNITLLLTGIMLGYIYGALQSMFEYFANPVQLKSFVLWGMGSISNVTLDHLKVFVPVCLIGFILSLLLVKPLNLFLLGDNYAKTSGLNIKATKWKIIILTGVLSGISTAFCGPIAFIGLAVPHLARIIFKTNNHKIILPASALIGAITLLFCDIAGNLAPGNLFIPINVTTSLIGAPIVIWLLFKNKNLSA
ncbi:MAG: iron ABC transporter permease [Bacteroidia bacterium]|nr:iron ABC transporter permease [Bacteroidia bacterium]